MKLNPNYKLRNIGGEYAIIAQDKANSIMTQIISLNDSAVLIYNNLIGKDFTTQDVADFLVNTYEVEPEQAAADACEWIKGMKECNAIID